MRPLFAGLLMFSTVAASAVQIGFDNAPGRGYADGSLVYQESGFVVSSDPLPWGSGPNPPPDEFFLDSAWSVGESTLRSCSFSFDYSCAFTVTHDGSPFVFGGFGALTSNSDWCDAVSSGIAGPTSGLTLGVVGSLGGVTRFTSSLDVHSCGALVPMATSFGSLTIDMLTVSTIPLNFIRVDDIQVAAVPEPGTYVLVLVGLLALHRRHRGRAASG
jgi:hypothetical protein